MPQNKGMATSKSYHVALDYSTASLKYFCGCISLQEVQNYAFLSL
jgi:hypothetical protein